MKIVRIIARLNVGGPARHVVWLNHALDDEHYASMLIAGSIPPGEDDMSYFAQRYGVEPLYIKEMSRELSPKDAVSLIKILKVLYREKPDIIHTHTAKAGTLGRVAGFIYKWLTPSVLIGRPRRVKVVHTFHGHVFHSYYSPLKTNIFLFIERLLAAIATDRILVLSDQQLKEINQDFGIGHSSGFRIVPLGIDLGAFEPDGGERRARFRREMGIGDEEILIGHVGRLTEIKNHSLFLRAIKEIKSAGVAANCKFVIVGDGNLRENLEKEASELGINDVLTFCGNRDDPETFYAGLDIVALTSFNEGTPLSLIEAMGNGCPVISTAVGGVIDLLGEQREDSDGFIVSERGIKVQSEDVRGLAKGLIYLAKDEQLRLELGRAGRTFVQAVYSKDRLIGDIKTIYKELTA